VGFVVAIKSSRRWKSIKKKQNNNNIPSSLINELFGNHHSYNEIDPTQHTFF